MPKKQIKDTRTNPNKKTVKKMAEYQEFIRFTAIPRVFREKELGYNSDGVFAKKYKVNPGTLSAWKKDQNFWDEVKNILKFWGADRLPDVLAGLYKKAVTDGNAAEVKLWLQYFADWKENSAVNVHYAAIKELQESNERLFEEEKLKEKRKNA